MRVGLTGGVASGKSTVACLFARRGVPVIDADEIARSLVAPGSPLLQKLVEAFGEDILTPQGALDRARMRERTFADETLRRKLEAILHPAIRTEMRRRSATAGGPYQIFEVPLLVETGAGDYDRVLVVDCSVETQLKRLLARDGVSEAQARAMLAAQASREQRLERADDVIINDGAPEALEPQVEKLHAKYLALAQGSTAD